MEGSGGQLAKASWRTELPKFKGEEKGNNPKSTHDNLSFWKYENKKEEKLKAWAENAMMESADAYCEFAPFALESRIGNAIHN